jgi:hypothetical protein
MAVLAAAPASAELTQRGDLFVRFGGNLSPSALPRHELAPIAVRIEGTIRVPPGRVPPSLRRIRVALNRAGKLDSRGLPVCPRRRLEAATSTQALAACGSALVGSGGMVARTALPEQPAATVRGEILLFNGRENGRPVILAQIYQTEPASLTRIVVFKIQHGSGAFGTVINGKLPPSLNHYGYLKSIFLSLERRYRFHGKEHSYLSAACSAPAGFNLATFPFARASMTFDDGRTLSSTMVRSCRVR